MRYTKALAAVAALAAATLMGAEAQAANLLVNGSFEDPNGNWTASGSSWDHVLPGSTAITGWTVGGGYGVDWHDNVEFGPIQNGTYAVDLNGSGGGLADTGTISQSFATVAGQNYHLSFYLAGPQPGGLPDPRQVNVDVNGVDTVFSQAASPTSNLVWGLESLNFIASGSSSTLTFSSVNGSGYWGPLLDNASVAAVPETSTWAMMLLGFGCLGFAGYRRNKTATLDA